jgi:exopolyphosphatase/guanosine-5'-triphosphate,3'-diphosphate pyrophosphatase
MRKVAIIDMGTNTFNLLVAVVNGDGTFQIINSSKQPVKLGEGGINQKIIAPAAYQRGLNAIAEHFRTILLYGATEVYAFATSATRNAINGQQFVDDIFTQFGLRVKIIEGDQEAEYIYLGVRQAYRLGSEKALILDIGGGSNELIIANGNQYFWKRSYDLGISRLLQQFQPSDPINPNEIKALESHFASCLADLDEAMAIHKPIKLIGSSGSFDTYRSILSAEGRIMPNGNPSVEIPMADYLTLHEKLIGSSIEERKRIPGMEPVRVEMIGIASLFTNFLIQRFQVKEMVQSSYALKEGAMWSILNG